MGTKRKNSPGCKCCGPPGACGCPDPTFSNPWYLTTGEGTFTLTFDPSTGFWFSVPIVTITVAAFWSGSGFTWDGSSHDVTIRYRLGCGSATFPTIWNLAILYNGTTVGGPTNVWSVADDPLHPGTARNFGVFGGAWSCSNTVISMTATANLCSPSCGPVPGGGGSFTFSR